MGEIAQEHHIGFIGNLHVTRVLFEETEAVSEDVQRCMTDGKRFPGYVFGLGSPLTQHVPLSRMQEIVITYKALR